MRAYPISPTLAAALTAKARRAAEAVQALHLPAPDHRFDALASTDDVRDEVVDASGITIGGEDDDDF